MHQYIMHTQQMPLYGKKIIYLLNTVNKLNLTLVSLSFLSSVYLPLVAITVHHIVSQVEMPPLMAIEVYLKPNKRLNATLFIY